MSHDPTDEEIEVALAKTAAGYSLRNALTAANTLRDRRIRDEALEEAAAHFLVLNWGEWKTRQIADAIRALKDKEPNYE